MINTQVASIVDIMKNMIPMCDFIELGESWGGRPDESISEVRASPSLLLMALKYKGSYQIELTCCNFNSRFCESKQVLTLQSVSCMTRTHSCRFDRGRSVDRVIHRCD